MPREASINFEASQAKTASLLQLYGRWVLPESLLEVVNAGLQNRVHIVDVEEASTDNDAVLLKLGASLAQLLVVPEEKPVLSRFWFAWAVS